MATMNVPGIGAVNSKWVIGGAALTLGIVGYAYYRQSQQAAEDAPTDTTDQYAVDQGVGYGYAGVGTDFAGDGSPGSYYGPTYSYPPTTSTSVSAPPVTNLDWSSQAVEYLQEQGVDSQVASLSTSKYLLRDCLTPTQADVVRMAVGRFGVPPQSQDLRILQCPTTPSTPPSTVVTKKQPTGLRAVNHTRTTISLDWNPVGAVGSTPGLVGYQVYVNGKRAATLSYSGVYKKGYLRPNTSYRFQVFAVYRMPGKSTDERGPGSSILTARTSK